MSTAPRIINVSNRLPIKIVLTGDGPTYAASEGGLATGLSALSNRYESLWIGWPGAVVSDDQKEQVTQDLKERKLTPVFLSREEITDYYEGFCNETIWPLFHYFPSYTGFSPQNFQSYVDVNQKFADEILKVATSKDIIWIHDYQLMLVPQLIRKALPGVTIGFFLHIPFPAYPIFMALPWRREILEGLMGANVVGFQTYDDVHHFTDAANRILDINFVGNEVDIENRTVVANAFPISIDYEKFQELAGNSSQKGNEASLQSFLSGNQLAISVDRLDYSKGIIQRLRAFELFLERHPEWREKVTFLHLVVPSRDTVRNYKELKEEMDRLVSDINGKYSTLSWQPIRHFYRSVHPGMLAAIYKLADVALVTPLRDGMNLVSKEFVACKLDGKGVLLLSETAGAARELHDALIVNPNDTAAFANQINTALTMPEDEKVHRMQRMQHVVANANIFAWADSFMEALNETMARKSKPAAQYLSPAQMERVEMKYCFSSHRLLLLDYDGTLVPFHNKPEAAKPDDELLNLLSGLSEDKNNKLVIISGRDHETLHKWLGPIQADLIAEHGAWFKESNGEWYNRKDADTGWKPEFSEILNTFTRATPGALVEEKGYSIAWHYRQCDPALANRRIAEIRKTLESKIEDLGLQLQEGDKVIEIKNPEINKGRAARKWMSASKYDFVMAIGDDTTDEDMFTALPSGAVTIKVGTHVTAASSFVNSYKEVRALLQHLKECAVHFDDSISLQLAG